MFLVIIVCPGGPTRRERRFGKIRGVNTLNFKSGLELFYAFVTLSIVRYLLLA